MDVLSHNGIVRTGPPAVGDTAPTDPDGDGQYGALSGNGQLDDGDVELPFNSVNRPSASNYHRTDKFNDNGQVDYGDVIALYEASCGLLFDAAVDLRSPAPGPGRHTQ